MQNPFTAKEQSAADTPLLLFTCTTADGSAWRWSSRTITWNGQICTYFLHQYHALRYLEAVQMRRDMHEFWKNLLENKLNA